MANKVSKSDQANAPGYPDGILKALSSHNPSKYLAEGKGRIGMLMVVWPGETIQLPLAGEYAQQAVGGQAAIPAEEGENVPGQVNGAWLDAQGGLVFYEGRHAAS